MEFNDHTFDAVQHLGAIHKHVGFRPFDVELDKIDFSTREVISKANRLNRTFFAAGHKSDELLYLVSISYQPICIGPFGKKIVAVAMGPQSCLNNFNIL